MCRVEIDGHVVTPPPFELDGKVSLATYLVNYENYFDSKFKGTEFDKTQQLGKFLKDDLLMGYKIKGERKLEFKEMMKQLLDWFKRQNIGSKSYWQDKFPDVQLQAAEAYDMYSLRSQEIYGMHP